MNDIKETLKDLRTSLSLTEAERSVMRAHLERLSAPAPASALPSPFFAFFMQPNSAYAFALAAVLVIGGGGIAQAQGALPGDVLYPIKVHVNESVERVLAMTPEAKADVDIKHAEERLSEIELLAAKGDVNESVTQNAAKSIASAIAAASTTAGDLSSAGDASKADDIRAHIASALLAHADILDAQAEELGSGTQIALRALSVAAAETADSADSASSEASTSENAPSTAELAATREGDARERIDTLTKAIGDANDIPQETHDALLLELSDIEGGFAAAGESLAAGDYADASEAYQRLERRAYRALAALGAAQMIAEKTGKEVLLSIDHPNSNLSALEDEGAPTLLKAAPIMNASATGETRSHRHERPLQFLVRDRIESDGEDGGRGSESD